MLAAALWRWESASRSKTPVQSADDTEVVLGSMPDVGPFLECMHTYAQASGQQLHLDKVELNE